MYFAIQACNPTVLSLPERQVTSVAQAIAAIFPEATEEAFFIWNWVPIRVSYKFDLSVLFDDIPILLDKYLSSGNSSHRVYWGSNTFRAEWRLQWTDSRVRIESNWDSIAGNYQDLLNSRGMLEMEYGEFLWEWKALLKKIIDSIDSSGVRVANEGELGALRRVEEAIPKFGRRYEE